MGRRERAVAAERQFGRVGVNQRNGVAIALAAKEGGCRQIVLGGDRLHRRFGQPFGERHDRGGVAGEETIGEGVDLIDRQAGHIVIVPSR